MRRVLLSAFCLLAFLLPLSVNAVDCSQPSEGGFVPLACYQGSRLQDVYGSGSNAFGITLNSFWTIAFSIGGLAAIFKLVEAGFLYQGKDFWDKKQRGKEIVQDVVLGLLILFGVWLILYQINPCILDLSRLLNDFSSTGANPGSCSVQ